MIHIVCVLYGDGTCIPNENCFFSHLLLSEQLNVLINSQGVSALCWILEWEMKEEEEKKYKMNSFQVSYGLKYSSWI